MYLGIDLGTGSVKLMLADGSGAEQVVSETYPIESPQAGYAETDPRDWIGAIRKAVARLPPLAGLRGIGLSGQMHGIVPLDSNDVPVLERAILWADQRGGKCLGEFEVLSDAQRARLLNAPSAGMSAASLLWLKREAKRDYDRIRTLLMPKDYIRFAMTGTKATDYSDASGTVLYDFKDREWYGDAIAALGLDRDYLPPLRSGTDVAGAVSAAGAALLGLPEGTPVAVGGADAPTGMYGSGLHATSQIQVSVGTAAQISRPVPSGVLPGWNPALNVFEGIRPADRYQVAAMLNAGIALEWVRKTLKLDWEPIYAALEGKDLSVKPDILFLPYLSGERTPYMNPDARGAWLGLGLHHDDLDLAFAALLGVACSIRLGLETIGTEGAETIRAVGGSLRYEYWRQLIASVLGRDLAVYEQADISARGAAYLAAEALGEGIAAKEERGRIYRGGNLGWIDEYFRDYKGLYARINGATKLNWARTPA